MKVPTDIAFHGIEHSDALEQLVEARVQRLDELSERLVSCHVVLEAPHRSGAGDHIHQYRVRVTLGVPGKTIVAESKPSDETTKLNEPDMYEAVDEAFDRAERRLREHEEILLDQRRERHESDSPLMNGVVSNLQSEPEFRYGFINAIDGRQVYFHENALVDVEYEALRPGMPVDFFTSTGAESPDPIASTVRLAGTSS